MNVGHFGEHTLWVVLAAVLIEFIHAIPVSANQLCSSINCEPLWIEAPITDFQLNAEGRDLEVCAKSGRQLCMTTLAALLVEQRRRGQQVNYTDKEMLYLARSGFCNSDKIGDDSLDGHKLTCLDYMATSAKLLQEIYRTGELGVTSNVRLSDCWTNAAYKSIETCNKLELNILGKIQRGKRPEGISGTIYFP